jgi:hypothetical protein
MEGMTPKEEYRALAAHLPVSLRTLEPKRYAVPEAVSGLYAHHGAAFISDLSVLMRSLTTMRAYQASGPKQSDYSTEESGILPIIAQYLRTQNHCPTYFMAPDIGESLLGTAPPEDTPLSDIRAPFPSFRVWLPKGLLLYGDCWITYLTISTLPEKTPVTFNREMIAELRRAYPNLPPPMPDNIIQFASPLLLVECAFSEGDPVQFMGGWDEATLGRVLESFRATVDEVGDGSPVGWDSILRFTLNVIMLLGWVPDEVSEERLTRKARTNGKGEITRSELWTPRFIGRPVFRPSRPSNPYPTATGVRRFDEVRGAHWKRQAFGPGRSQRRPQWVSLYRTRSMEERGIKPEG